MSPGQKDTITTRIISTVFTVLALAIFKPFGLDSLQWMGIVHLLALGLLGLVSCTATEGIMKYVVKKPRSLEHGVDYIIRRNLWFQLINTPLVALLICLYRHFVMSDTVPGNVLSWGNFFETLLIIAFCSFAIGLYWRFKFRSKYLTATAGTPEGRRTARPCSRVAHRYRNCHGSRAIARRRPSHANPYPRRIDQRNGHGAHSRPIIYRSCGKLCENLSTARQSSAHRHAARHLQASRRRLAGIPHDRALPGRVNSSLNVFIL